MKTIHAIALGPLRMAALAAVLFVAGCTATPGSIDVGSTKEISVERSAGLARVNAFRSQHGLPALRYSNVLDEAATRQARAMAARGKLSHSVEGALPARVQAYGYNYGSVAENIGWNYPSTAAVISGWENSAGHRRNLLKPEVTEIGFAAATGRNGQPYWAMILGTQAKRRG